jgi:hypothetical protein
MNDTWYRREILCGIALLSLLSAAEAANAPATKPAVPAQKAAAAPSLPKLSVDQIVEKSLAAGGGASAWKAVQSMTLSGQLDAGRQRKDGGNMANNPVQARVDAKARAKLILEGKYKPQEEKIIQLPFKLDLARPNKQRLEIPFRGDTALQVYDGATGWKLRPYLGRREVESYSKDELAVAADDQELDGPLVNYAAKGTHISLAGTEVVDGRPAYRLTLKYKDGSVRGLWIDGQSFLEVKIEGAPRRRDGHPRAVMSYLKDYRKVDGLMIPFLRETHVAGESHPERIVVEKVVINPALTASNFAKPS